MTSDPDAFCPLRAPRPPHAYGVTRARLHRGHFAYLRAVVQGLSPRAAWERYLPDAGAFEDTPHVHRMSAWIRTELSAAAARGGDFGQARLLRLDLAPLPDDLPSLEAFIDREALDDLAEAEQLAAYQAAFDSELARQRRRATLLRRQLGAIYALEARVAVPVALQDGVEAWFTDAIAQRLQAAGLPTLYALRARMASRQRWWGAIPGIGPIKAGALAQFMAAHFEAAQFADAPAWPVTARQAPSDTLDGSLSAGGVSALMPMERLIVPDDLTGRQGRFRAPPGQCLLDADDDRAAILAWLAARGRPRGRRRPPPSVASVVPAADLPAPDLPAPPGARLTCTQLAYRKEAERFLLWAVGERRRALSSMTVEDCLAYRDFLLAPPAAWCGPRAQPRWKASWRPFAGPLSLRSCAFAVGVLGNLFAFLVDQGYLIGNPWRAVVPPAEGPRGPDPGRGLTASQWQGVLAALARLPDTLSSRRLQFALPFLHDTGLRLAELLAATTADLSWEALPQPGRPPLEGWWLTVRGKGDRIRQVPVSPDSMARLSAYLLARGLPADPGASPAVPLIGANPSPARARGAAAGDPTRHVAASSFHRHIRTFFARCAQGLRVSDPASAARLGRATTHWLRHTHVWHALDAGVPVEIVQQNVGHVSLDTTTRYVKTERVRRLQAMQQLWQTTSRAASAAGVDQASSRASP
ncbi:phage integrase family protein [Cupriavidus sp. UBA2526]|uniref:phage integrase family protein n=1 Tax=Cupriavidus sp. UBA2526 TaxID=1946398 RepID=UPI00257F00A1|nr:phage integrase family protein [Cupriavidus sp. UBA2526]